MDVLEQELQAVHAAIPDLFVKPPSGMAVSDKLRLAAAFLELHRLTLTYGT